MNDSPDTPVQEPEDDTCTTYRTTFGPDTAPPSTEIVSAVATLTDTQSDDLPPLYEAINPDALNLMFQKSGSRGLAPNAELTFTYTGHSVTVHANGFITIDTASHTE